MVVPEYHEHACGCDGALPFCRQIVVLDGSGGPLKVKKKTSSFPIFHIFFNDQQERHVKAQHGH